MAPRPTITRQGQAGGDQDPPPRPPFPRGNWEVGPWLYDISQASRRNRLAALWWIVAVRHMHLYNARWRAVARLRAFLPPEAILLIEQCLYNSLLSWPSR